MSMWLGERGSLALYTIIDMIETAETVWSDSCVCAMVDRDLKR